MGALSMKKTILFSTFSNTMAVPHWHSLRRRLHYPSRPHSRVCRSSRKTASSSATVRSSITPEQTTGTIHAFVSVTPLEYDENANIPEKLEHISGIDSCDAVSGSQVYVLTVTVPTVPQLEDLVTKIHRIVPSNVETTMVLHRYFPR